MSQVANEEKILLEQLRAKLEESPFALVGLEARPSRPEPMTLEFDAESFPGTFYVFTAPDNRLLRGWVGSEGREAIATYSSKDHGLFASLRGELVPCADRTLMDRFWSNRVAAWFPGGDKHECSLLRFDVSHLEMWTADLTDAGKLKAAIGRRLGPEDTRSTHVSTQSPHN